MVSRPAGAGLFVARVVVPPVIGLIQELAQRVEVFRYFDMGRGHDWTDNETDEDGKHQEVQDGVAHDAATAELGLLERVDWGTNLTTGENIN